MDYLCYIVHQKKILSCFEHIFRDTFTIFKRKIQDDCMLSQQTQMQTLRATIQVQSSTLASGEEDKIRDGYTVIYPQDLHNLFLQVLFSHKAELEKGYLTSLFVEYIKSSFGNSAFSALQISLGSQLRRELLSGALPFRGMRSANWTAHHHLALCTTDRTRNTAVIADL